MQKTCHTILKTNGLQEEILQSWADSYAKDLHTALAWVIKANKNNAADKLITSLNAEQNKALQAKFGMNTRHVNSINIEIRAIKI